MQKLGNLGLLRFFKEKLSISFKTEGISKCRGKN